MKSRRRHSAVRLMQSQRKDLFSSQESKRSSASQQSNTTADKSNRSAESFHYARIKTPCDNAMKSRRRHSAVRLIQSHRKDLFSRKNQNALASAESNTTAGKLNRSAKSFHSRETPCDNAIKKRSRHSACPQVKIIITSALAESKTTAGKLNRSAKSFHSREAKRTCDNAIKKRRRHSAAGTAPQAQRRRHSAAGLFLKKSFDRQDIFIRLLDKYVVPRIFDKSKLMIFKHIEIFSCISPRLIIALRLHDEYRRSSSH